MYISVTVLVEFDLPVKERVAFTLTLHNVQSSTQMFSQPYSHLKEKGCRNLGFSILSEHQTEELTLQPLQCHHLITYVNVL